jgi:phytoene dehydrogenase-like protein
MSHIDAVVIGSGPNGLAAAIAIARTGRKVIVFEAADTVGGACQSAELTLPGYLHDVCSAVHPFAVVSPFFQSLPLSQCGLEWITPPVMLAHPLDKGPAACLYGSLGRTGQELGGDEAAYRQLFEPLVESWPKIAESVLGPLRWPRHPLALARFGLRALQPATGLVRRTFSGVQARALFAGIAAHSMLPLEKRPTGGIALALTLAAHVGGWCFPRGGA